MNKKCVMLEKAARLLLKEELYRVLYILYYQYLFEMYAKFSMLEKAEGMFKFEEQTHGGVSIIILSPQCKPQHRASLNRLVQFRRVR
jgi:hypothetical protein